MPIGGKVSSETRKGFFGIGPILALRVALHSGCFSVVGRTQTADLALYMYVTVPSIHKHYRWLGKANFIAPPHNEVILMAQLVRSEMLIAT